MHVHLELLALGVFFAAYGSMITFHAPAAAYIRRISLDKHWLPPHLAKYSVQYVDGAFTLGLGATLIVAAFFA